MPRYAPNKVPAAVKRRYFELIRTGIRGARAADEVGVSLSCGSFWFIDGGSVSYVETPISGRYLSQDDRIEIADGLARGEQVKSIAAGIGKSYQSAYPEIARTANQTGGISRGTHTTLPMRAGGGRKPDDWLSTLRCARRSPARCVGGGPLPRSVDGCDGDTRAAPRGRYVPRRFTRRSIEG